MKFHTRLIQAVIGNKAAGKYLSDPFDGSLDDPTCRVMGIVSVVALGEAFTEKEYAPEGSAYLLIVCEPLLVITVVDKCR
jgi:hypothetical protein